MASYTTVVNEIKKTDVDGSFRYKYLNNRPLVNKGIISGTPEDDGVVVDLNHFFNTNRVQPTIQFASNKYDYREWSIATADSTKQTPHGTKFLDTTAKVFSVSDWIQIYRLPIDVKAVSNEVSNILKVLEEFKAEQIERLCLNIVKGIYTQPSSFDAETYKLIVGDGTAVFSEDLMDEALAVKGVRQNEGVYNYLVMSPATQKAILKQQNAAVTNPKLLRRMPVADVRDGDFRYEIDNKGTYKVTGDFRNKKRAMFYLADSEVLLTDQIGDGYILVCEPGTFKFAESQIGQPYNAIDEGLSGDGWGLIQLGLRTMFSVNPYAMNFVGTEGVGTGKYAKTFGVSFAEAAAGSLYKMTEYARDTRMSILHVKIT